MELKFGDGRVMGVGVADRPRMMGILNVTPDSFSDGGEHLGADAAVAHALQMVREGADLIDVGGESTRPGSQRVPAEEQIRRVVEPIRRITAALGRDAGSEKELPGGAGFPGAGVVVSVDTTLSAVGRAALDAGASMLNDISGGREDPGMLELAGERGVPIVLMHMLGEPATMQDDPRYEDVVREVRDFLLERAAAAERAGVPRGQIVLDPGIGFGKTVEHNLRLLAHLDELVATGYAVLLAASRKRFIAGVSSPEGRPPEVSPGATPPVRKSDPKDRVGGTVATTVLGVAAGVRLFRVHDVAPNRQAADVAWAVETRGHSQN